MVNELITKSDISFFPDILEYFKRHAPNCVNIISSIPIVKVSKDSWEKFCFVGHGYLVKKEDIIHNFTFLELYSKNKNLYDSLPSNEHKRDVNIYKISKKLNNPDTFVLIVDDPNAKFFVLHEFSHVCGIDESFNYNMKFDDEYLDRKEEQSAYLTEMRYAKQQNMSFEDYFRSTHPDEFKILNGGRSNNVKLYDLASLDKRDYKKMWDSI